MCSTRERQAWGTCNGLPGRSCGFSAESPSHVFCGRVPALFDDSLEHPVSNLAAFGALEWSYIEAINGNESALNRSERFATNLIGFFGSKEKAKSDNGISSYKKQCSRLDYVFNAFRIFPPLLRFGLGLWFGVYRFEHPTNDGAVCLVACFVCGAAAMLSLIWAIDLVMSNSINDAGADYKDGYYFNDVFYAENASVSLGHCGAATSGLIIQPPAFPQDIAKRNVHAGVINRAIG
jgi:hypothetical protein